MTDEFQAYLWQREWLEAWRQIGLAVEQWARLYVPFMAGLSS